MNVKESETVILARGGCAILVVLVATLISTLLVKFRPETHTQEPEEPVLAVEFITATTTNLVVSIETQGLVKPVREVALSPQVSGRVLEVPRELKAGDLVTKDELLLKIDPVDYQTAVAEARSTVSRIEAGLELLEINQKADEKQLQLSKRSLELAETDFARAKKLSEEGQAVSVSVVESTERALTQAASQVLQLEQALAQVPGRRQELESELQAAESRLTQSELQLQRTEIRAPFSGRITHSDVEAGEVLSPGMSIFRIADDTALEIAVPVTADDLRRWIAFEAPTSADQGWFPPVIKVPVQISWSAAAGDIKWQGRLDRMIRFDATTRTAMLAVRISGTELNAPNGGLPLTEGMFCQVRIPGKEISDVIALPRASVTFDNQAYLNKDGRLKTVQVDVLRSQEDLVYVSGGIQEGDRVIITRLVAPLEGVKLLDAGEE